MKSTKHVPISIPISISISTEIHWEEDDGTKVATLQGGTLEVEAGGVVTATRVGGKQATFSDGEDPLRRAWDWLYQR